MTPKTKKRIDQIQNNEIPKGYKQTKFGIIPEEWEVVRLKDKFDRLSRKNTEGNTNVLTISAQYGLINQEEFFKKEIASNDKSNYYLLHRGEFAYNKSYSNGYPFGAIKRLSLYDKGVVSPLYICFSANSSNACPEYYEQYFEAGRLNHEVQAYAQEGARNHGLLNISVSDFFNSFILMPPIKEQKRIANILSAQDKVIECYEKKIAQLKRMKKYYLQNMFPKRGETVPKIRFKGFTDPWEQRKLGEVFVEYSEKGHEELPPLTIIQGKGTILREESDRNLIYDKSGLKNYKLVNQDDFILHLRSFEGGLEMANTQGIVSPAYHIFHGENTNTKFYYPFFRSKHFISVLLKPHVYGIRDGKSIDVDGMKSIYIPYPSIKEQIKIGNFFSKLDTLITLQQHLCDEEKKKKKVLQQLLLTGIVRIKG